jgi:hypothetical protein
MPERLIRALLAVLLLSLPVAAPAAALPPGVVRQLPRGFAVIASARSDPSPGRTFYFVALEARASGQRAPVRPLLLFDMRKAGRPALAARNDHVIFRLDEGGYNGCDPFEQRRIAAKGAYVTVEQGIACGDHWTDYVTFRFDRDLGTYIFDNRRIQSWSMNDRPGRSRQALVSDGQRLVRSKGRVITFAKWARPDR